MLGARFSAPGDHSGAISDFWGRAPQLTLGHLAILFFLVFQQLATILCPLEPHRDSGFGGAIGLKSYLTVVEILPF